MSELDLVVRGARLTGWPGDGLIEIAIAGGVVVGIEPQVAGRGAVELDARGRHVLAGGVDPHVHFNEPGGRTHWEGFATGTSALAAGGVTTGLEMPLNASPPTIDIASFDGKRAAAERVARVDFGLWAGIVPGNLDQLEGLAERGAVGFKAFMSTSGVEDFPASDDLTLYEAMSVVAELGLVVGVHAENDTITRELAERARREGRVAMRDYLRSRPAIAETEAIARAIELAGATGCALHVVHVSTGRGALLVAEARSRGIDVSCEVTPHHLILNEDDVERLATLAKCAPPLRPREENDALWEALDHGGVALVASDHSPSPPELRDASDAFASWGGIAGCQSTLELLLTEGHARGRLGLTRIAEVFSEAAARRFRLAGKGAVRLGGDGDLVIVELGPERVLAAGELRYRHRVSPYVGRTLRARVVSTVLRGTVVYAGGELAGEPRGRFVRPGAAPQTPSLRPGAAPQKPSR